MPISCGKPKTKDELRILEAKFNFGLPEDYKEFLRFKNGFVVKSPDFCELEYECVDEGVIAFYALFGINMKNPNHDIFRQNKCFLNELDFIDDKLIIGGDPGGNFYLILNGSESQGVYYWDRTHLHADDDIQYFEFAEQNECGNIYKITNSFTEFHKIICKTSLDAGMNVTVDL
ncbi:SMI1/KNR4 family protein [Enterobacter hormaechei]|uniref:SMI1/KNR4 family protein n=1 Tax=Enterobacter hormaechei TaxID=158836 RepID=UPI0024DEC61E|nr:SMI1/KNR4 family protein [Enterobacter hormaechei]MDK2355463.1 SMI1/KNR4 family protein [Enterobacter hormaechei]WRM08027.1 SMI1/KNR4 family protein [Enterobacter hormaechei]